ncbi:MAG TPA: MarR family transcriptional regulator [Spirochaetia bacterium]|nr:MarR family transcriptional regulator [Spirochaetia bacterium]
MISRIREKANRFIMREMSLRGMEGLATSHGDILVALFNHASLSMTELARMIDREKPTVTVLVDKLVTMGYVCKATDQGDKRVTLISLTPKGRALQPDFDEISALLLDSVYRGISDEEKEVLINALMKISKNL